MSVTKNKHFPIHLWLMSTIIVGPILLALGSVLNDSSYFSNSARLGVIILLIPFGLAFSFPTFIVIWLAHSLLTGKISPLLVKWLLIILAVIGVFVTFSVIGGPMAKIYSLIYSAAVIVSGLILRERKS